MAISVLALEVLRLSGKPHQIPWKRSPQIIWKLTIEAIKQCAMPGMGMGVLPAVTTSAEISHRKLAVLPWRGKTVCMITQILRHKQKWVSPALQAFLDVMNEGFTEPTTRSSLTRRSKR
ncbi:MAG: hypothetical protein JO025_19015 [Verrucomicrobia bacterium]|nr:hypothetical protein [Verrucomicrobiota bacterium]